MNDTLGEIKQQTPELMAQAEAAQKQLEQARADSAATSISTNEQLKLARQLANAAASQSRLEERAWVGIIGVDTETGVQDDSKQQFSISSLKLMLRNSGKTPALNVSVECCKTELEPVGAAIPDYDDEVKKTEARDKAAMKTLVQRSDDWVKEHPEATETIRRQEAWALAHGTTHVPTTLYRGGVIAPEALQGVELYSRPMHFTAATINPNPRSTSPGQDVPMVPATIYILGRFTYFDVFTGSPRHITKFCLMRTTGTEFAVCPESNWMD
jgi:hypothetical protein